MNSMIIASNMLNEIEQLPRWFEWVEKIADGILIVDTGSTDGTLDFAKKHGATVITDDIIQREGYGAARNQLRNLARVHFPGAHWLAYFDADETVLESDFHHWRFLRDYLDTKFDIIALPRIDWFDFEMTKAANDFHYQPDYQARMSRLGSGVEYYRKLHEMIRNYTGVFNKTTNPKINHFHRAIQSKRDFIGKLCAKLHMEDKEFGHTLGEHPKEAHYRELLQKEGL
jgi:glycosyltransferase involved in cell wall biosynthesis